MFDSFGSVPPPPVVLLQSWQGSGGPALGEEGAMICLFCCTPTYLEPQTCSHPGQLPPILHPKPVHLRRRCLSSLV